MESTVCKRIFIKILVTFLIILIGGVGISFSCWGNSKDFNVVTEEVSYHNLKNDVEYQVKFLNLSTDLTQLCYYFKTPADEIGTLTVGITTEKGLVISSDYTFQMKDFSNEVICIPSYVKGMEFGKWYVLHIKISGRENKTPIAIQCGGFPFAFEIGTGAGELFNPYLQLIGNGNYFIWKSVFVDIVYIAIVIILLWIWPFRDVVKRWQKEGIVVLNAFLGYIVIEIITGNLSNIGMFNIVVNVLIIYLFQKVVEVFLLDSRAVRIIVLCICTVLGLAEYYVMQFRGTPITPWDLQVLETAITVSDAYDFSITQQIFSGLCLAVIGIMCNVKIRFAHLQEDNRKNRLVITIIGVGVFCIGVYPKLTTAAWDMKSVYQSQGFIASFVANIKYLNYKKPSGYSTKKVEKFLEDVKSVESEIDTIATNIIIIMNESFADLRRINDNLVSDEYMPFIDSLNENVVKGNLVVPVFGNGTCDTEFEVLTGISTKYTGSYPYVTKVNKAMESLISKLNDEKYSTLAFHPYFRKNWNRDVVYSMFGFDEYCDIDKMDAIEEMRWCVSDTSNYEQMIAWYEKSSQKNCIFNVTMQNHGGYESEWGNFDVTVDLSAHGDFPEAEQYYSLIKESDKALEELIMYFKQIEEPTLICFFGDHLPNIEIEYYELLFGCEDIGKLSNEENMLFYQTPFFIWANYDIPEKDIEVLSANYLETLILYYAGYELEGYDAYTYYMSQEYPVISKVGIIDAEGNYYLDEKQIEEKELLQNYEFLNYYRMQGIEK